ncbi:MAG TPA: tetratricopeptide repeat protein [Thermoanaerobaculia bacterium]|nr:tetratricopeptide repeat protein [Thermoanaerobaculia bacterium]
MNQLFLVATLLLAATLSLEAQTGPPELEEASEVAQRAASAAIRGPQRIFSEALDVDGLLLRRLGADAWQGLQERQRGQLRSAVKERFLQTLAPPRSMPGEVAWSSAQPSRSGVDVLLGLRYGEKTLKTRWMMHRAGAGWRVEDVVLSDPGISLAEQTSNVLGPRPARRRGRGERVRAEAYPRAVALAVIGLVVFVIARRTSPARRGLLYLTASALAILFLMDGVLAVGRALSEPYALEERLLPDPRRQAEELALQAQNEGRLQEALEHWSRALALGGQRAPIEYQMGLAAQQLGQPDRARSAFERALAEPRPAPGAAKELATLALSQGRYAEAQAQLTRYLTLSGPDPDALSLQAVAQTNLGKTQEALGAIHEARRLVGEGSRGAEIEAEIQARAGNAAGAVAALRPLEAEGRLDRFALRANPAYVPIAADPAWVSFLNERPPAPNPTPQP